MLSIKVRKNKQVGRKEAQQRARLHQRVARAYAQSIQEENERERLASIYWIKERSQWLHRDSRAVFADDSLWREVM